MLNKIKHKISLRIICSVVVLSSLHISAASYATDTCNIHTDSTSYSISARKFIAPAVLIGVGAMGVGAFTGVKHSINRNFSKCSDGHYWHGDEYLRFAPAAAYLSLGLFGIKGRNSFSDRLLAGTTAYICAISVAGALKHIVKEGRPDGSSNNSFPSGHAVIAFTGAELIRVEYGNAIGAAGYAVAVGVGLLRMYNNRHWYNEVLAGAGLGILSARVGYWLLPLERRMLGLDKNHNCTVMPFWNPYVQSAGVSFSMNF